MGAIGVDSCRSVGDDGSAEGNDSRFLGGEGGRRSERTAGGGGGAWEEREKQREKAPEEDLVEVQWIIYS